MRYLKFSNSNSNAARIIVLAIAVTLLSACTTVKLAYNNAPTFGYFWLNGYLDFDDTQSARLREDLASLQQWHRSKQLPEYAELLQRGQALAAQEQVTAGQLCAVADDAQRQLADIGTQSEQSAAQLARSLTPAQLTHLEEKYAKSNADFREEWLDITPQKLREKRYDKALERAEHVYGRLDTAQRALLRQQVDAASFDPRMLQSERQRRQQDTVQTLRSLAGGQAAPEQAEQAMRGLFTRYRTSPRPEFRAYARKQIEEGCETVAQLHNTASPKQREQAVKRLQAYERDFRALAAQR